MEDVSKLQEWLENLLRDAKRDLKVEDATIAYVLIHRGLDFFLKSYVKGKMK